MPKVLVNGAEFVSSPAPHTWSQLLGAVDASLAGQGLIVTEVRFDGLEEPAFRDPVVSERAVDDLATIEVAAGTPASLMERTLQDAALATDSLGLAADAIGQEFRGTDVGTANQSLAQLAESLRAVVGIVGAVGLAFKVDLDRVRCGDRSVSTMVGELTKYMEELVTAQRSEDWITVADVLQYDMAPALKRWRPLLEALVPALGS
jgi:hypothetical protein